jgi:hypothetical protein
MGRCKPRNAFPRLPLELKSSGCREWINLTGTQRPTIVRIPGRWSRRWLDLSDRWYATTFSIQLFVRGDKSKTIGIIYGSQCELDDSGASHLLSDTAYFRQWRLCSYGRVPNGIRDQKIIGFRCCMEFIIQKTSCDTTHLGLEIPARWISVVISSHSLHDSEQSKLRYGFRASKYQFYSCQSLKSPFSITFLLFGQIRNSILLRVDSQQLSTGMARRPEKCWHCVITSCICGCIGRPINIWETNQIPCCTKLIYVKSIPSDMWSGHAHQELFLESLLMISTLGWTSTDMTGSKFNQKESVPCNVTECTDADVMLMLYWASLEIKWNYSLHE